MSQNIIALSTAEQLAAAIPEKEQNTLLFEIFKFAAWGLDNKDNQEMVLNWQTPLKKTRNRANSPIN